MNQQQHGPERDVCDTRRRNVRVVLILVGLIAGLGLSELCLAVFDRPRLYRKHTNPPQFQVVDKLEPGSLGYVNLPSANIQFIYDGNPRGYFGTRNEVDHVTNKLGFRGPEFELRSDPKDQRILKTEGKKRLVFLGDSFTFGEGVRFEDTYPEVCADLLTAHYERTAGWSFESYNFGVGGHNTTQSLRVLERFALRADPDAVVLGYVLNDAEPPLFERDPRGGPKRRRRAIESVDGDSRLDGGPLRFRTAQLIFTFFANRQRANATESYYRGLFTADNPWWGESRLALRVIAAKCGDNEIPCCVVLFPILHRLGDYPFQAIHESVRQEVESTGTLFVDLLPELEGKDESDLWVHPTDHHPNEVVLRIAARKVAETLIRADAFDSTE